jgi:pimeloyl-ACP methyl ester carboxylesterase
MTVHTPLMPTSDEVGACVTWPRSMMWTSRGRVEYADRGTGMVLLSVHGTPGGGDQGLLLAEFFRANGFRLIAPSRPGYLGTPLASGRTPGEQADMLAAVLDALQVERAAVLGVSGGGPSTYLMAARHPDRVACLMQIASLSMPWSPPADFARSQRLMMSRLGNRAILWLFDNRPSLLGRLIGSPPAEDGRALREDPYRWAALRATLVTVGGKQSRRAGYDNDLKQFATLSPLQLQDITCPTLLVHGTADTIVPSAHLEHAAATIPAAEVHWIDQGTHLTGLGDDATHRRALDWLTTHAQTTNDTHPGS